jgi:hypothetical protein
MKDWHMVDTANEKSVPLTFCELVRRRPKIAMRRTRDRELLSAIRSYDLNRRTQAEDAAFAAFEAVYSRKPVAL